MAGAAGEHWTGRVPAGYQPDLAIICGYGSLPLEIAQGAVEAGRHPYMIGIEGEAEKRIRAFPGEIISWGQLGRLFRLLRDRGIKEAVFAGGIHRRPEVSALKLDWGGVKALPQVLIFMLGGDNTVLSGTIKLFEKHGISVVGAHQIAPQLLAAAGTMVGRKPGAKDFLNIRRAFSACKAVGHLDIGQAAIAEGGRVVAVEAAEGTDEMLARVVRMRKVGRMPEEGKNGVLVKTMKPGQDDRADLPAIGPRTVAAAAKAGLKGIALEAGHSIILEREKTLEAARSAGLYLYGVEAGELGDDG
ncbi:MAG: UDP-2,3-diacylglucosamine diphosphatase LpxI [Salaquimonas sp.]|nr:UDP-2,3-diacylglucosamine diphosphatase LpxI [Salaquimonas sp.]